MDTIQDCDRRTDGHRPTAKTALTAKLLRMENGRPHVAGFMASEQLPADYQIWATKQ